MRFKEMRFENVRVLTQFIWLRIVSWSDLVGWLVVMLPNHV
jgi:hypothetical protein